MNAPTQRPPAHPAPSFLVPSSPLMCVSMCALMLTGALTTLTACEDNRPPQLLPLPELTWQVNRAQALNVLATDPEGDPLTFSFELTPPPPTETEGVGGSPSLTPLSAQEALFQWTPGVGDAGEYALTLTVSDPEGARAQETLSLRVTNPSTGGAAQLAFSSPAGAGVSVSRGAPDEGCLRELPVVVQANALPNDEVFVSLEAPTPEGVTLWPAEGVAGKERALSWCPSQAQLSAQERFTVRLKASHIDEQGITRATIFKSLLVRFARQAGAECPGQPPRLEHTSPPELSGLADYELSLRVFDESVIKSPPLLAYLVNPPQDPRVSAVSGWELVELEADRGATGLAADESAWRATLPNLNLAEGERATLYYRFLVTDNDDPSGAACDHSVEGPISSVSVRGSTEGGALGLCAPCGHSGQCGGERDLCLTFTEGSFCALDCRDNADDDCPLSSACYELTTTEGELVYQCLPLSNSCVEQCTPDRFDGPDPNTDPTPTLSDGIYEGLAICAEDADFYWLPLTPGGSLSVEVSFDDPTLDLDLALALRFEGDEPLYEHQSASANSTQERLELSCVRGYAEALLAVYPYVLAEGSYTLSVTTSALGCDGCARDEDCAEEQACVAPVSGGGEGVCRARCFGREECLVGEECKPLPGGALACVPEGSAALGALCEEHIDCAGTRACVPSAFGVGVCLDVGCEGLFACPEEERCVRAPQGDLCAPSCAQGSCPGRLRCQQVAGGEYCLP